MGGRAGGGARSGGGGAMAGSRNGLIPQSTMEALGLPKELNKKGVVFDSEKSNIGDNYISITYAPDINKKVTTFWKKNGKEDAWTFDNPKEAGRFISSMAKKGLKIKITKDMIG